MTLAVQAGTRAQPRTARLQSAAVPRGLAATAPTAPDGTAIDANDLLVRCNPDGSALLDLAVGFDAEGNPLKATYAQDGVALDALGGAVTVRPTAAGQRSYSIRATVTNVLGLTTVLTKGFTC
jgi:hypothetical protein